MPSTSLVRSRCFRHTFFFSSRRRHTRCGRDWSSDVCSSDLFTTNDGNGPRSGRTEKIHSSERIVRSSVTDDDPHVCRVDHKRIMHKLEGMFDQWDGSPAAQVPQKVRPDERSMIRRTDSRQHQTPARSCGLCRALDLCSCVLEQLRDPIRLLLDSVVYVIRMRRASDCRLRDCFHGPPSRYQNHDSGRPQPATALTPKLSLTASLVVLRSVERGRGRVPRSPPHERRGGGPLPCGPLSREKRGSSGG